MKMVRIGVRRIYDQLIYRKSARHFWHGVVAHDIDDRTFIFYPLVEKEQVTRYGVRDFIDRMFAGSPRVLVSHLIKQEKFSPEGLKEIRELIDKKEK